MEQKPGLEVRVRRDGMSKLVNPLRGAVPVDGGRCRSPGALGSGCANPLRTTPWEIISELAARKPLPPRFLCRRWRTRWTQSISAWIGFVFWPGSTPIDGGGRRVRGPTSPPWGPSRDRWGRTHSEIGYHGGKVKVARPRVRDRAGKEVSLESWQALRDGNLLLEWALNLMVLNVSTRKYHRAVRLPEGDLAKARGDGTSKSAVSRRFVALSRKKMNLARLGSLGTRPASHPDRRSACRRPCLRGGDRRRWQRRQHVLAVVEGATNTVVVQALLDNLLARGLDPTLPRLFIVDGAKALSKAIRKPSVWPPPSSAARSTRAVTSSSAREHLHAQASRRRSVRPGTRTTQTRPSGCCATWPGVWSMRNGVSDDPGGAGRDPGSASACRTNSGARSPAPTSSKRARHGAPSAATQTLEERRDGAQMDRRRPLEAQKTFRREAYRQLPILRNALQNT